MSHGTASDEPSARARALFEHAIGAAKAQHDRPLASDVRKMSSLFTGERQSRRGGYMNEAALRRAYLGYFAPLNAVKTALAIARLQEEGALQRGGPIRIADLGAGPLSATLGCWLAGLDIERVTAVDRSVAALEDGRRVLEAVAPELLPRVTLVQGAVDRLGPRPERPDLDLVVLANVLNELGDPRRDLSRRVSVVESAVGRLAPGGVALVLEPATRVHARALMAVRDALVQRGHRVLAPCTGARTCPLLPTQGSWCFSEYPFEPPAVAARLAKEAGFQLSPLKAALLCVGSGGERDDRVRVVSGMMREGPLQRRYLCTERGLVTARGRPELPGGLRDVPRGALVPSPGERWLERERRRRER